MAALVVLPPVPAVYGDGWRDEWARRFEASEPWLLRWLEEQRDGPYWRQGSLRPGYERIECATMLVGGWADGYRNNTFRTFEALRCPKRLLVGPWSHMSPATSLPGPRIDLVPELIRWFRRWLCDEKNGVDEEPPVCVFVRRSTSRSPTSRRCAARGASSLAGPRTGAHARPRPTRGSPRARGRGDLGTSAWISCAARLPWGQPSRPARGRRPLARVRMGAVRLGARDPRPRAPRRHHLGKRTRRLPLRQALRRLSGRNVCARRARLLNLDAPRRLHRPRAARAGPRHDPSRSSSRQPRGSSSRAPRSPRARGRRLAEHLAAAVGRR